MALVGYVNAEPDLKDRFSKLATPLYKTKHSSLRWNGRLIPPRKKYIYTTKSLLPQIKELWDSYNDTERLAWKNAGAAQGYTGWSQFVQDTAYRLKFGIPGLATPSTLHGYKVGRIELADPADFFRLEQIHPVEYFQMKKVPNTKSQREPVSIIEQLQLPLTLGLSYRANLTSNGATPYCKFYGQVVRSYQSLDLIEEVGFDIPLSCDWERNTALLANVVGVARWYSLYIELSDVLGFVEFDLLQSTHNGTNFGRDFRCTNISSGFSNFNYQIPASWAADSAENGVTFGSVYPVD